MQQQRRRSTRRSHGGQSGVDALPADVLQLLAACLNVEDLASASATCKAWAQGLRKGLTRVKMVVPTATITTKLHPVQSLAVHSPNLNEMQVLLSGRSNYTAVQQVLSNLCFLQSLQALRLTFLVSPTPKKGPPPIFFSDSMLLGHGTRLVLDGSAMPEVAVTNLLQRLVFAWNLKELHLLSGQPTPGSQLPFYKPPVWMQQPLTHPLTPVGLSAEQLSHLVKLKDLTAITFPYDSELPLHSYQQLTALKGLTSIEVLGSISLPVFYKLAGLTTVRRLAVTVKVPVVLQELEAAHLRHLTEVNIGLEGPAPLSCIMSWLQSLLTSLPSSLKGLTLSNLTLDKSLVHLLSGATSLNSLQLSNMLLLPEPGLRWQLDLSCLAKLQSIRRFGLSLKVVSPAGLQIAFQVPDQEQEQPPDGEKVVSRRSRRLSQLQQRQAEQQQVAAAASSAPSPAWGDMSGLAKAWPNLQQLQLSELPASSVTSCWNLKGLTDLTSLKLQLMMPAADPITGQHHPEPLKLGNAGTTLKLQQLPGQLQDLQVENMMLGVPSSLPFENSLTSLSLSSCLLRQKPAEDSNNIIDSVASNTRSRRSSSNNHTTSPHGSALTTTTSSSHTMPPPPLPQLIQNLPQLQQLELINVPWLDDAMLAAAGAAAAKSQNLTSLSVLGIGNQGLTQGGLLGITGLKKLRQLRWHVGDLLELMPDLTALAQLRGLVALHIPTWLYNHMERWSGFAVLDKLPLCDVHVESIP